VVNLILVLVRWELLSLFDTHTPAWVLAVSSPFWRFLWRAGARLVRRTLISRMFAKNNQEHRKHKKASCKPEAKPVIYKANGLAIISMLEEGRSTKMPHKKRRREQR